MLPKEAIEEFKQLYKNDTGILLSDKEATKQANDLFNGLKVIFTKEKGKE